MAEKKQEKPRDVAGVTEKALTTLSAKDFAIERRLTMDATSIQRLGQVLCQTIGELEEIEMPPVKAGEAPSKAWAVPILDVVRGEQFLLICNAIMVSSFRRVEGPLTGNYFAMQDAGKKDGKRYRSVDIVKLQRTA